MSNSNTTSRVGSIISSGTPQVTAASVANLATSAAGVLKNTANEIAQAVNNNLGTINKVVSTVGGVAAAIGFGATIAGAAPTALVFGAVSIGSSKELILMSEAAKAGLITVIVLLVPALIFIVISYALNIRYDSKISIAFCFMYNFLSSVHYDGVKLVGL